MRVTFKHGEKHGILGTHYYLALTVNFTPTERAVIKQRELVELTVAEGSRKPIATRNQIEFVKGVRIGGPLLVGFAVLSKFFGFFPYPIGLIPGVPTWLLFGFLALTISAYVLPHLLAVSAIPDPVYVEQVLQNSTFRLYAVTPYHCKILVPQLCEQLARLKLVIDGSADLGPEETFEF